MILSSRWKKVVAGGLLVLLPVILIFGVTVAEATDNCFTDVSTGDWFHDFVCWMFDAGLTSGYPDGSFRPNNNITRAEVAVFMQQVAGAGSAGPVTDADTLDGLDSTSFASQSSLESHDHMIAQGTNLTFNTTSSSYSEVIKVTLDIPDKCIFIMTEGHNVLVSATGYYLANGGDTRASVGVSIDNATSIANGTRSDANIDSAANARSPYAVTWLFTGVGSGTRDFYLLARHQLGSATSIDLFDARLVVQHMGYSCGFIIFEPETEEIPDQ